MVINKNAQTVAAVWAFLLSTISNHIALQNKSCRGEIIRLLPTSQ